MKELPSALAPLGAYRQFILYKAVPSESRPGKTDKLPLHPKTQRVHSAHDPAIWMTAKEALDKQGESYGIGFVFTKDDPFWVVDIDSCLTPTGWAPHAIQICQLLSGSAIEMSRSGKGLHVIGSGKPPQHSCKNEELDIEFYDHGRFIALTGLGATGDAGRDQSMVLASLVARYFPADPASANSMGHWSNAWPVVLTGGPDPEWRGPADDKELIRRALRSKSANSTFGTKVAFADLWLADEGKLAASFPDPDRKRPWDESRADSSLAQHLAFWTGKDCERIERLMWQSKLVRDKWGRQDYLPRTILGVVGRQIDVLQQPEEPATIPQSLQGPTEVSTGSSATAITGDRTFTQDQQIELFAGCVYVTDCHRVLVPNGHLFKPDQFRVHYGGRLFYMMQGNDKFSSDPWEAFTQSQILEHPKVQSLCFRPELPFGEIIWRNGVSSVNTYVPVEVPRVSGDVALFLQHVAKLLPNAWDQMIIVSYMAACVQHKGVKFEWAPLLQGVEGNGKTLLTLCLAEAIGRRYVHWPKASKLAAQFNSWMVGKILYAVEDIYVPGDRRDVIEELKPMITGKELEIEGKGVDQVTSGICGNFMFNSNHRDAIAKTRNDRRFCVLFTAQQGAEDLIRDGMTTDYFSKLYNWLKSEDGFAKVTEFLCTFQIPAELNPATECKRAPQSSTTGEAITASQGAIEQEILEAISQGLPGFCGGWVSSMALDKHLEKLNILRRAGSHLRRKEMLESLGYRWHPAFKDGRVNNPVIPDQGKPRLYVHDSNLAKQITDSTLAAKEYERANTVRPPDEKRNAFKAFVTG